MNLNTAALVWLLTTALLTTPVCAASEQVIYNFPQSNSAPTGPLHQGKSGALYGVGYYLGAYRLKQKNGSWSASIIPIGISGAGLAEDPTTGVLYGEEVFGGAYGAGSVFSLTQKHKMWTESVIHSFDISDGRYPQATLFRDKSTGALYGTSFYGGTYDCGTIFQMMPSNGGWDFQVLYSFKDGDNGCTSVVQLRQGPKAGSFIGATFRYHSPTTVFEIKELHGAWTESPIYTFYNGNWATDVNTDGNGTVYGVADSPELTVTAWSSNSCPPVRSGHSQSFTHSAEHPMEPNRSESITMLRTALFMGQLLAEGLSARRAALCSSS